MSKVKTIYNPLLAEGLQKISVPTHKQSVQTTNAVARTMTGSLAVPSNGVIAFRAVIVGVESATGDVFAEEITGAIKNLADTTTIVDSINKISLAKDAGAATWVATATADDANDELDITVTGEALHTINWTCNIYFTKITF